MEGSIRTGNIVLLLDQYSVDSENLYHSIVAAGYDCPAVVIEEDGFLPEHMMSVYGYFLGYDKNHPKVKGSPRYFNQIPVPDYWEISGNNTSGSVHDLYRERGRIFYAAPLHKRLVKVVDWLDECGVVRSSDHYNRYGALFARTIFNADGKKVNRSYFDAEGREVIMENFVTGDIILSEEQVRIFHTKVSFICYFLKKAGYEDSRIFYNSLSTPFFVSQSREAAGREDILFWQEPARGDIPGNMQLILQENASRTQTILVQKRKAYDKLIALGANPQIVQRVGFVYPFVKENRHRPEALICTNSDQIAHCQKLVEALPQLHFHIAAITEMSPKLMRMGQYDNVSLYPGIKMERLDELFASCDYYLDINHGSEIVSAVYQAFLHNHLLYAFVETIHNRDYIPDEHCYPMEKVEELIADLRSVLEDADRMEVHLQLQHEFALAETEESFGEKI